MDVIGWMVSQAPTGEILDCSPTSPPDDDSEGSPDNLRPVMDLEVASRSRTLAGMRAG